MNRVTVEFLLEHLSQLDETTRLTGEELTEKFRDCVAWKLPTGVVVLREEGEMAMAVKAASELMSMEVDIYVKKRMSVWKVLKLHKEMLERVVKTNSGFQTVPK
jgi:nitrogen fixation/metabolism regulation signal transduction histidine kinase